MEEEEPKATPGKELSGEWQKDEDCSKFPHPRWNAMRLT